MLVLYHGSGSGGHELLAAIASERARLLIENAVRLLRVRDQQRAVKLLTRVPFEIFEGTNDFGDEFFVLHAVVQLPVYEWFRKVREDAIQKVALREIANTLTELGVYVRFIELDLALAPATGTSVGLTAAETNRLVNKYIGVHGGYLADFSYRTHQEFYDELDLSIDTSAYGGTTRAKFIEILLKSTPAVQAKILEGVLARFPEGGSPHRTPERAYEIRGWIERLRGRQRVSGPRAVPIVPATPQPASEGDVLAVSVPTAFISYSWDTPQHKQWVRAFAARLRADGIDVHLDQWDTAPGDQLPAFMERAIRENRFVLLTCTPHYKDRSDNRRGGVGYEGDIMTAEVAQHRNDRKFIPILRGDSPVSCLPSWLAGKYFIDLHGDPYSEEQYRELLDTLHGRRPTPPPLGQRTEDG